jgi:hypothetical protein
MLRLLKNWFCAERLDNGGNQLRLMAYYSDHLLRAKRRASSNDVFDERASSRAVQNLCEAGFEPSTFPGSENNDSEIVIGHEGSILHFTARI